MNRLGVVVAAVGVALSVMGLTASLAQYLNVRRQQEVIKTMAVVQVPVVRSVERFIDPATGSFALSQLKNYQADNDRFTAALLKSTASMTDLEMLCLFLWFLTGVSSSITLLLLLRRSESTSEQPTTRNVKPRTP